MGGKTRYLTQSGEKLPNDPSIIGKLRRHKKGVSEESGKGLSTRNGAGRETDVFDLPILEQL